MRISLYIIALLMLTTAAHAQNQLSADEIRAEVDRVKLTAFETYKEYLSLPNYGHDHEDIAGYLATG